MEIGYLQAQCHCERCDAYLNNLERSKLFIILSNYFVNTVYPEKFGVSFVIKKAFRVGSR